MKKPKNFTALTPERQIERIYIAIAKVWEIWFEDRQSMKFGGLSMKERDEILTELRNKLETIQRKVKSNEKRNSPSVE